MPSTNHFYVHLVKGDPLVMAGIRQNGGMKSAAFAQALEDEIIDAALVVHAGEVL